MNTQETEEEHPQVTTSDHQQQDDDDDDSIRGDGLIIVEQEEELHHQPPIMSNFVTNCIFYLLGIGLLIPWNAFVNAKPYFTARLCRDIEVWFGFIYNISSVLSLACLLLLSSSHFGGSVKKKSQQSTYWMVMIPLAIFLAVFVLTCILVFIPVSSTLFLILTLMSLATCGAMGAIASAGCVATASTSKSVGPLFSGQAVGGVVVSAANFMAAMGESPTEYWDRTCVSGSGGGGGSTTTITTKQERFLLEQQQDCVPHQGIDWAMVTYFGVACLLLAACLVGFQYLTSNSQQRYEPVADVEASAAVEASPRFVGDFELEQNNSSRAAQSSPPSVWSKIRQPAITIYLTFVVTLSLFPAWTASLQSAHQCRQSHERLQNDLFTPLTFLWFNVFDLVGRLLAERYSARLTTNKLIPYALARCIFFLLFALLPTSNKTQITPIPSDLLSFCVQAAFGASNGFLVSWSFMVAPSCVQKQEQVKSSELLNFALSFGLLSGSLLSFVYVAIMVTA